MAAGSLGTRLSREMFPISHIFISLHCLFCGNRNLNINTILIFRIFSFLFFENLFGAQIFIFAVFVFLGFENLMLFKILIFSIFIFAVFENLLCSQIFYNYVRPVRTRLTLGSWANSEERVDCLHSCDGREVSIHKDFESRFTAACASLHSREKYTDYDALIFSAMDSVRSVLLIACAG